MMTLGARIGVGSLAGIALAIYYGGVGTIFWIWVSTIICSANAFCESLLGAKYRQKDKDNYVGGPSYYIANGLNKKSLGKIYAIALLFTYILGFLTVQSNTMVKSITMVYHFNPLIISTIIIILTFIVILKGLNNIADFSSKLVPFMTLGYTAICLYIIITNINQMPDVILSIVSQAFNPTSMGIGILTPLIIGFQKGTFSNEAGIGTGAIAAATSNTDSPSKQGFIQVAGIYIETLILSTITAFVIILSNYQNITWYNINGIEITQKAFTYHLGNIGNYVVIISILLFAFSTIITGYYYGESSLKFIFKKITNNGLIGFKLAVLAILLIGGISSPTIIWFLADIFIAILGIINVCSLFLLRKNIIDEYHYYKYKKK
jgi:AGCS family alanine or glycine:cation symporter